MGKIETIWCETVDSEARNVIKSDEHRFASKFCGLPRTIALKEKDFLLTCCGQSAINIFTAFGFNGNFVFVPVEHRRQRTNDHVPQVSFQ
jgi:hypothetical protein